MAPRGPSIKDVAARARDQVESICARWLQAGRRKAGEWVIGDRTGAAGESLKVHLTGDKVGVWSDFATGDKGGDLVSLVAFVDGVSQGEAAKRLSAFLGLDPVGATPAPAPAPKSAMADSWKPVQPVPSDAPAPPQAHPKHGRPDARYEYRDRDGALLFLVDRWEKSETRTKKEFAPLVYCVSADGRRHEWRRQGAPKPRPLWGLELLCERPEAAVVLVEGEKSALAARELLPDHLVLAWPGGANAVTTIDFTPLRGRDVILWADADDNGRTAMKAVSKALRSAGAASRRWLNLQLLATARGGGELPKGFDAADLQAEGWTAERLAEFLRQPDAIASPKKTTDHTTNADARPTDSRYRVDDVAVWYLEPGRNGEEPRPVRVCDPLHVVALARTTDSVGWSVLLRFADRDGIQREELIPLRILAGDGADAVRQLVDLGLRVEPGRSSLDRLKCYLAAANPTARARLVDTIGWHGDAYVLPDDVIGDTDERCIYSGARVARDLFTPRGSLDSWKKHEAALAVGNPRLMFALSIAFTGPLLMHLGAQSFAVHWTGDSSIGKSSLLAAAGSVWGEPAKTVRSWRGTDNSMEYTAAQHCDNLLILDELKEVDPKQLGQIVYMLSNEKGKARAHHAGGLREAITWRIAMQSSGEVGLADHMASAGQRAHAGQAVRFIELPADAGHGKGIWESLHHLPSGRELSDQVKAASRRYYGTAGRAFVAKVIEHRPRLRATVTQIEDEIFEKHVPVDAGGQLQRVAKTFALVAAAGELAAEWGIVPWKQGEAQRVAGLMLCAWKRGRPSTGNLEDAQILQHVVAVMQRDWQSKFIEWNRITGGRSTGYSWAKGDDDSDTSSTNPDLSRIPQIIGAYGFRKIEGEYDPNNPKFRFYIETQRFKEEFCRGFQPVRVAKLLKEKGVLFTNEKKGLSVSEALPNGSKRSYCLIGEKLWQLAADLNDEQDRDAA